MLYMKCATDHGVIPFGHSWCRQPLYADYAPRVGPHTHAQGPPLRFTHLPSTIRIRKVIVFV